jgi:hypothetical protein
MKEVVSSDIGDSDDEGVDEDEEEGRNDYFPCHRFDISSCAKEIRNDSLSVADSLPPLILEQDGDLDASPMILTGQILSGSRQISYSKTWFDKQLEERFQMFIGLSPSVRGQVKSWNDFIKIMHVAHFQLGSQGIAPIVPAISLPRRGIPSGESFAVSTPERDIHRGD